MLIDRFGNEVINEPEIIEEPIVETYDPNRPVRSGFEKSEMFQEGLFDKFKRKIYQTLEELEESSGITLDKDFKKYYENRPDGVSFWYEPSLCSDKYSQDHCDDIMNNTWHMMSYDELLKNNSEYVELNDNCVVFAESNGDNDCLWIATDKSKNYEPGSILMTNTIDTEDPWYNTGLFAKSFKDLLKNATFEKDIKEYSEMDLDEMSDYIQEQVITEATSRSLKEVKQHQTNINKNAVKADMTYIQNFARKCVKSKHSNSHRNLRRIILSHHYCKNEKDLFAFNYLMELYEKTENKKYFNQFFKLFGFEGSRVEIRGRYNLSDGLELSLYVVTNGETYIPAPGRFFIHTTQVSGITALDSSTGNGGEREYAENCIFFFAIKANDIRDAIKKLSDSGHKYGKYAYQYIPKKSDRFFVDSYHNKDSNTFGKRGEITAVFIQVKEDQKLPVKDVSNFFKDANDNKDAKKRYIANIKRVEDLKKNRIANIKKHADKYTRKINEFEAFLKDEPYNEDYYIPQINELKRKLEELDKSYDDKIKGLEDSIMLAEKKYGFTRTMVESYIDEIDGHVDMFMEEKLSSDDRKELDDKCFGLVYTDENGNKIRKYPLTDKNGKWDEKHIRQAVRFFGHCPKEHQHQLALNILHAAHKIGLDTSKWDTVNKAAEEKDNDD